MLNSSTLRASTPLHPATDSGPRPGDFPLGSPESRAAARLQLKRPQDNRERVEIVLHAPRPRQDNTQPHATPWVETPDGKSFRASKIDARKHAES